MLQPTRLKQMLMNEPEKVGANDRQFWNGFVDFLDKKGLKGSAELDKKDIQLSKGLFDEYAKGSNKTYEDFVPKVQSEISKYRENAIQGIKEGSIKLEGYQGQKDYDFDTNFMSGLSGVDGFAGSKTTSWKFPSDIVTDKNTKREIAKNQLYSDLNATNYKRMKK